MILGKTHVNREAESVDLGCRRVNGFERAEIDYDFVNLDVIEVLMDLVLGLLKSITMLYK